jgi:hypothetical protein
MHGNQDQSQRLPPGFKELALITQVLPFRKKTHLDRAVGVAQVVECLPSKCEAISSNPSIAKNTHTHTHTHTFLAEM